MRRAQVAEARAAEAEAALAALQEAYAKQGEETARAGARKDAALLVAREEAAAEIADLRQRVLMLEGLLEMRGSPEGHAARASTQKTTTAVLAGLHRHALTDSAAK